MGQRNAPVVRMSEPLLIDLLACDLLGDGFATVIDAVWMAAREDGAPLSPDQLDALRRALLVVRDDPAIDRERAYELVESLARAGLQTEIAAFDRLADVPHDDDDH